MGKKIIDKVADKLSDWAFGPKNPFANAKAEDALKKPEKK